VRVSRRAVGATYGLRWDATTIAARPRSGVRCKPFSRRSVKRKAKLESTQRAVAVAMDDKFRLMATNQTTTTDHSWSIYHIMGTTVKLVGIVDSALDRRERLTAPN